MKRKLSFLLVFVLLLGMLVLPANAATALKGKHGTDYATGALAARLEHIFYSGIDEGVKPSLPKVGEYFSKSTAYTTSWTKGGGANTAWTCMAYGQAAYNYLFGYRYGDDQHSKHFAEAETSKNFSYSKFKSWGVKCGAYLRVNPWFGSDGHSFIILGYDTEGVITLEGNWDGNGKIDILRRPWSEFNNKFKAGSVPWFVQPIQSVYDAVAYPGDSKDAGGGTSKTTTESGTWIMYVPAGQYLPLYSSATATSKASSVFARPSSYRFKCTQKATTNGKTRYKATFDDHGTGRDFWFECTGGMYVTKIETKTCTTHTKGEFRTIDDAHPHYRYYDCAVCGTVFKTNEPGWSTYCSICNPPAEPQKCTTHTRGEYQDFEAAHPHRSIYKCAVCGERYADTSTSRYYEKCTTCNPPKVESKLAEKVLNVNWSNISSVGKMTPNATNCGCYALAYHRSVKRLSDKSGRHR